MERPHITDSTGAAPGAAIVIEDDSPFTGTQDSFCTPERALLSPSQSSLPPPRTFLKWLHLGPGITPCNFMAYLCATLLSICLFVFLNASQGFVLGEVLKVPKSELGNVSGSLSFYDELLSLLMVLVWGLISDKLGRRWVYVLGFIIAAGGLYLFTFATQVYPDLLLYRLVFAVGAAGCSAMLTAVLADYAGEKDRGKMAGLVGLCSGLGALVALFVFLPLVTTLSGGGLPGLRTTYLLVATITIGAAILLFFTLAPHTIPVAQPFIQEESSHVEDGCLPAAPMATLRPSVESQMTWGQSAYSVIQLAQDGLMAGKDPKIILGYFSAFLARGDSIILTIFIPLWVYKYYIDAGLCSAVGGVEDPDLKESCKKAYINASILSGVAQTLALVGAPFFGFLSDKLYRPLSIVIAGVIGFAGYFSMFISPNPTSPIMYFIVSLAGLGEIGMVVGSLSLVTSVSVPVHVRGAVAGVSSFCGAIGILVNTKLGGYLFDAWTEGAPFFLMAVGHALCTILAVGVTTMDVIKLKREQQSHLDAPPEKIGVLQALKNLQVSQEKAKHEESSPSLLS